MSFPRKRRLYESMPLVVKHWVCRIPFAWIAGRAYRETWRRGDWFDLASMDDLRQYREQKLGEVLRFAVNQVPAYKTFRDVVDRYKPWDALKAFPLLDKESLQAHQEKYLARDFDRIPHYETSTGGTTGNQLRLFLDDPSQSVEMGFMHRQWRRVDYTPREKKATFRGVSFSRLKPGIFWQHNPIYNELQFSPFHMTEAHLGAYVDEIIRFSPAYVHGYPSAIDVLAEYVLRHGLTHRMPSIRAALLGSEGTTPAQRERIARAFGTRVFTWYGHSEMVVLAGECEKSSAYHSFPDYGILEILDEQGNPCDREGERGEIVGTGLFNRCMPLIRYRTGDCATRLEARCGCGRCWDRFGDVEGRWKQDAVIGRSGARISVAALNMHGPVFEHVVRYQYYQEEPGRCLLKVVGSPVFSTQDRMAIQDAYRDKVGDEVDFTVQLVADIPLTARGKLKMLDSRISSIPAGVPQDVH